MIAYNFHAVGKGAVGRASVGQGALAHTNLSVPSYASSYRASQARHGEQQLVLHLTSALERTFPRTLLVAYYVALKTSPFVLLTGREGTGKAALAASFAAATVGTESGQFVTIGSDSWTRRSSQSHYYRGIHERFGLSQLLETLHEAALAENSSKLYLILLKGMTEEELELYTSQLLQVDAAGQQHLALPDLPVDEQPLWPSNCLITATLHTTEVSHLADRRLRRHIGQIALSPTLSSSRNPPTLPLPPVGLQRTILTASRHSPTTALAHLRAILGRRALHKLRLLPETSHRQLRGAVPLNRLLHQQLLIYVAHSFDRDGHGLFDPHNPERNARIAYNTQLVQRMLGRTKGRRL